MLCRLGSKVAMFRYSSVEIYSARKPPLILEFNDPNKKDWLDAEVNNVCFYNIFAVAAHFSSPNCTLYANNVQFFRSFLNGSISSQKLKM
jgi:hypothetical protein